MGGLDHETDHDGECFRECKECYIKKLELSVENLQYHVDNLNKENKKLKRNLREADSYRLTTEQWEKKWGKDAR